MAQIQAEHVPVMQACQIVEFGKPYEIRETPVPSVLAPHDILLRVAAASFCHTDAMVHSGVVPGTKLPITASHEGCGTVVKLGSEVEGFKLGDRVLAGIPRNRCGSCRECNGPDEQYCDAREGALGMHVDGAFAEYLLVDTRNAALIPDVISFVTAAPLACAGLTVWRGLEIANLSKGQFLGVVGSGGGLGHLAIKFAKCQGLNVIGIDARDEGIHLSSEAGADYVFDAREGIASVIKKIRDLTEGEGVSATLNLSDAATAAPLACAITTKHGSMIQIAQPPDFKISFHELVFRDIHVSGSLIGSTKNLQDMLDFVATHNISVKTSLYQGLEEISKLVEESHNGTMEGKGVVVIDSSQL